MFLKKEIGKLPRIYIYEGARKEGKNIKDYKKGDIVLGIKDAMFKRIWQQPHNLNLLAFVLSEIINYNYNYIKENLVFKNSEFTKDKDNEKRKIGDLVLEIEGTTINLEANTTLSKGVIRKNSLYHHKLAANSYNKGESYNESKAVIQINFDSINKFDDRLVIEFALRDKDNKFILDDNFLNYHINMAIALEKYYNNIKLSRFEKVLVMHLLDSKEELLRISKGDKELETMAKDIIDFSSDDDVYLEMLEELARNIDINEAKKEGVSKGERAKSIDIAKNMIKDNVPIDVISRYTSLSIEEIQNIK